MPFYQKRGMIPPKRHTVFKKPDGTLYREQVMGTRGFSGIQSIVYHLNAPTEIEYVGKIRDLTPKYVESTPLQHRHFATFSLEHQGESNDPVMGRNYLLGNEDLRIAVCRPAVGMDYFYRNAEGDEILFVHEGKGYLETIFGTLSYEEGDYLVIPVGTTYRVVMESEATRFLVIESSGPITTPRRYRNEHGQLLEHSPYCERDIRTPEELVTHDEKGKFEVRVKLHNQLHSYEYGFHPLDTVGWDGYLYPWAFNIKNFEPITGRIHLPPPVHQTFEGEGFVICSFVPRLFDYHPEAIPAPYYHSNVDSDEVLYYVDGHFMSRKGISEGSMTLHPMGLPHGPHPGTIEASIGKKDTYEYAVMIDTFKPLRITKQALSCEDEKYVYSWLQKS
jgi:homogentisate 1,2-dioxygenase